MKTLYFTVKEWSKFDFQKQEILTRKYNVILSDYKTRKEKIMILLNKINAKNFNKGINSFNKSINQFTKTLDSFASETKSNFEGLDQGKNIEETLGRVKLSKNELWGDSKQNMSNLLGKSIPLTSSSVSIWPEESRKTSESKPRNDMEIIWGKRKEKDDE